MKKELFNIFFCVYKNAYFNYLFKIFLFFKYTYTFKKLIIMYIYIYIIKIILI